MKTIKEIEERWKNIQEPTEIFIKWLNSPESIKQREIAEEMVKEIKSQLELEKEIKNETELQKAFDILIKENNRLREKLDNTRRFPLDESYDKAKKEQKK